MPCESEGTTIGSQDQPSAQLPNWDFNDRKLSVVSEDISPIHDDGQSLCRRSTIASAQLLRSPMSYRSALGELLPDANEIFPEMYAEESVNMFMDGNGGEATFEG